MKKGWNIILVIVVICIAVGAVCAGVGVLTGADFDRIGTTLEEYIAEQHNVDADLFIHEWIPEVAGIVQDGIKK